MNTVRNAKQYLETPEAMELAMQDALLTNMLMWPNIENRIRDRIRNRRSKVRQQLVDGMNKSQ